MTHDNHILDPKEAFLGRVTMRLFILLMAVAVISVRIIEGEETTLDSGPPELSWDIMPGKPNVLTLNLTQSLSSSVTLLLSTTYAEDEELQSSVFFTLLASNYSSSWSISPVFQKHAAMLCFASRPVFHRATLVARVSGNDTVKVRVGQVRRIIGLDFGVSKKVVVSPGTPATFLVDPVSGPDATSRDRYFLRVRSLDDHSARVCAIVAAYAKECPFKDGETSVRTADMWFTALSRGAMTIRYERFRFNMPFFVSVVVMGTDDACHLPDFPEESVTDRTKRVVISIERTQPYTTYLSPIGYSLFLSLILVIFAFVVMSTKRLKSNEEDEQQHQGDGVEDDEQSVYYSPNTSRDDIDRASSKRRHLPEDEGDVVDDGADGGDDNIKPMVVTAEDEVALRNGVKKKSTHEALKEKCLAAASESTRLPRIRKGLERLNQHARLTDMTRILEGDVWFRRNRSRVYCYLVPLLSLFYFIPSIQFVFLVKQSESLTGSQDLCFHNFECAHPLNIFSDFNHVVSNTSYVIFGLAFLIIVRYKAHLLPESQKPKNDHRSPKGILQQLSVFYAMGFALAAQGFFSVCYHVCPTNHSLQFDSTMMYVMCMLGMVKIYQFRHPDANANAYSFFYFLGGIVLVEALALYSESWWIYGVFILFYVIMTIFIAVDCYYMGVARLDGNVGKALAKDILIFGWKDGHDGEDRNGIRLVITDNLLAPC